MDLLLSTADVGNKKEAELDVKKEAAVALKNAIGGGSQDYVQYMVTVLGVVKPLCDLLAVQDNGIILTALEALEKILQVKLGVAQGRGA